MRARQEEAEGTANAKPDRDQLQDIRAAKPRKVRVVKTVHERRKPIASTARDANTVRFLRVPTLVATAK
jgi:hypothetical protein